MSETTRRVPCSYDGCKNYRVHHLHPETPRGVVLVEVPAGHDGLAYCSLTCAAMDGAIRVRAGAKGQES